MAETLNENFHSEPFTAASPINFGQVVVQSASANNTVLPASNAIIGAANVYGIAQASQPTAGYGVTIQTGGWAKGFAAASLGPGAYVAWNVAASPGLVPIVASGIASGPSAISISRFAIGKSVDSAVAGGIFTVKIAPQEIF